VESREPDRGATGPHGLCVEGSGDCASLSGRTGRHDHLTAAEGFGPVGGGVANDHHDDRNRQQREHQAGRGEPRPSRPGRLDATTLRAAPGGFGPSAERDGAAPDAMQAAGTGAGTPARAAPVGPVAPSASTARAAPPIQRRAVARSVRVERRRSGASARPPGAWRWPAGRRRADRNCCVPALRIAGHSSGDHPVDRRWQAGQRRQRRNDAGQVPGDDRSDVARPASAVNSMQVSEYSSDGGITACPRRCSGEA